MNRQNTLSVTDARKNLFNLIDQAGKVGARYWITDHGRPQAVIMGADEFDSWRETMEVMLDFPQIKKEAAAAEREYKKGNYITLDDLSSRISKKSPKRVGKCR